MKILNHLVMAAAAVVTFSVTVSARADEPLLSPHAKANQIRVVPGTTPGLLDRSVKPGSPKAVALAESLRKVPGRTTDMLVRHLPAAPPRLLANEPWRIEQFQIAPLK